MRLRNSSQIWLQFKLLGRLRSGLWTLLLKSSFNFREDKIDEAGKEVVVYQI